MLNPLPINKNRKTIIVSSLQNKMAPTSRGKIHGAAVVFGSNNLLIYEF